LKCVVGLKGNFSANIQKHVFIVLDISGSMAGSAMNTAKKACLEMILYLYSINLKNVTLITYNHQASSIKLEKNGADVTKILDSIQANGKTSFVSAFSELKTCIEASQNRHISIIFFTDGQDTINEPSKVEESLNGFSSFVKFNTLFAEIHAIGFTADHDALLLQKLVTQGKNPGTFQYCRSASEISICIDSISGLLTGHQLSSFLTFDMRKDPIPLEFEDIEASDSEKKFQGAVYVDNELLGKSPTFNVVVNVGTHVCAITLETSTLPKDSESKMYLGYLKLGHLKSNVARLVKEATDLKCQVGDAKGDDMLMAQLASLIEALESNDRELDGFISELGKDLKTSQRKEIFPLIQEIKELSIEFYSTLKTMQKGQISNHNIATLNSLAYRDITKKGLQKKLDKRTQQNLNLVNEVYEKVTQIVSELDMANLNEKYKDLNEKLGNCVISCNSFLEALGDEDCFCLSFDIGRSQAAIADPTQVTIKNVYPSFITAGSFMYSAQFAINKNEKAHGGFERNAEGLIVKGAAQENITGILPLYICEENWKVAKLLMKPTMGWAVTLDPLGYSYSQVKTVPFLILAKLAQMVAEKPDSAFIGFQFNLVKETCIQIMRDGSREGFDIRFCNEITENFIKYVDDPTVRTVDIIASNTVFLAQIYIAFEAGYLKEKNAEYMNKFFKCMLEEELRRRQRALDDNFDTNAWLMKMLNVDVDKYILGPFKEFLEAQKNVGDGSGVDYAAKFKEQIAHLKLEDAIKAQEEKKSNEEENKNPGGDPRIKG
jgi:hypothetical protein